MKRFLAVYTGAPTSMASWDALPEAERQARQARGVAAWKQWAQDHAGVIVDLGGPLSRTKRASRDGVTDVRNNLAGYTIVEAQSHEAAARLFLDHPHFAIFPGDGVEIMEVMPIPAG